MISVRIKTAVLYLSVGVLLMTAGCGTFEDEPKKNVIARVGDVYLTADEISEMLPSYLSDDEKIAFSEKYVERWIKNQILYQNALKNGTSLTDIQQKEMDKLYESYIIENYMNVQLAGAAPEISDTEIKEYYIKHQTDYKFNTKVYHLVQLILEDRNKELFAEIKKSKDLMAILKKYGLLSRPGEPVTNGDLGYVEVASLNSRIAKNLRYRKIGDITPPIKINGKYFFLQLIEEKKPGDTKPLELVKDEIEIMLKARKRAEFRENLIKKLRTNYVIETFLSKLKSEVIN